MMTFHIAPWVLPTILSAVMLGFYDITKKHAVNANAVMPVLFFFDPFRMCRSHFVFCSFG